MLNLEAFVAILTICTLLTNNTPSAYFYSYLTMSGRRKRRARRRRKVPSDDEFDDDRALAEPENIDMVLPDPSPTAAGLLALFLAFSLVAGVLYYLYSSEQETTNNRFRPEPKDATRCKARAAKTSYKSEGIVRAVLEELFGVTFPSTRDVEWLRNPRTGRNLEFDCYNESLGIALEHNGEQHEKITSFTPTQAALDDLQFRDSIKDELAPQYGVTLLRTGYRTNINGEIEYDRDLRAAVYREVRSKLPQYAYLIPSGF